MHNEKNSACVIPPIIRPAATTAKTGAAATIASLPMRSGEARGGSAVPALVIDGVTKTFRSGNSSQVTAVDDLTRARGVTVSTVMQFAWAVLLSRITGQRTVVFGETVSGRPADLDGVETMVGLFINTLPAVADVDPGARAADVLDALQASKVAVLDHQHLGLPELTALVGRGQLFDTLAVHESYPVDAQSLKQGADAGGIGIEDLDATDSTHYPLNLVTGVVGDQIELKLKCLPAAFDERQVHV